MARPIVPPRSSSRASETSPGCAGSTGVTARGTLSPAPPRSPAGDGHGGHRHLCDPGRALHPATDPSRDPTWDPRPCTRHGQPSPAHPQHRGARGEPGRGSPTVLSPAGSPQPRGCPGPASPWRCLPAPLAAAGAGAAAAPSTPGPAESRPLPPRRERGGSDPGGAALSGPGSPAGVPGSAPHAGHRGRRFLPCRVPRAGAAPEPCPPPGPVRSGCPRSGQGTSRLSGRLRLPYPWKHLSLLWV